MIGRTELLEKAKKDFTLFTKSKGKGGVGVIAGVVGSGKTLFARTISEYIIQLEGVRVFGSFLNPLTQKKVFNNWRHILISITERLAIDSNTTRQEFIQRILEKHTDMNTELLSEILGLPIINAQPLINSKSNTLHDFIACLFEQLPKSCMAVIFLDDCSDMDKVNINR
jgi:hypothetical protein